MQLDPSSRWTLFASWTLVLLMGIVCFWRTGRLTVHPVPDSPSYLNYPLNDLDEALRSTRTPGYPLLLAGLRYVTGGVAAIPAIHLGMMFLGVAYFSRELRCWGMPWMVRWCAAWSVLYGCTTVDQVKELATDAPAAACGVFTIAAVLAWSRRPERWISWLLVLIASTAAISLRPAYLFLPLWAGVAGWLLLRIQQSPLVSATVRSFALTVFTTMPILAWMLLRWTTVNDFGVLPFGGQSLAGVLIQLVPDEQLRSLPGASGVLADEMIKDRDQWIAEHGWIQGAPMEYMTWENRWHDTTFNSVYPAIMRIHPNDPVAAHRAIQSFNRDFMKCYPERYVVWLAKAMRRGAWGIAADIIMHPLSLLCLALANVAILLRTAAGRPLPNITLPVGFQVLLTVALTYMLAKTLFVILTSPPLGRFSDAAAILLPACIVAIAVPWFYAWIDPETGKPKKRPLPRPLSTDV